MLGLERDKESAKCQGDNARVEVTMVAKASLNYEVYQTPAFSMNLGHFAVLGNEINLTEYTSLTGYGHGKYTMAFSFRPDYTNESYNHGEYLGHIGRFQVLDYSNIGVLPDGWFICCVANTGYNTPVNLALDYGTPGWKLSADLPGSYLDWQHTWFYIVISVSISESDFTDWNAPSWSNGDLFVRITIYDQETGELYLCQDRKQNDATMPDVANLANPLVCGNPYNATADLFDVRLFNSSSVKIKDQLISNFWCSYGTMFDPLSIDQTTTSWRTTRPSKQIGNAVAWCNMPFIDSVVEETTHNKRYWVKMSGDDLFSGADNKGFGESEIVGYFEEDAFNPNPNWGNRISSLIPKDRNT